MAGKTYCRCDIPAIVCGGPGSGGSLTFILRAGPGSPHPAFTLPHQGGLIVECAGTTGRSDYDDGIRYRQRGAFLWRAGYSRTTMPLS
jgi:hypothetical protein